MNTTSKTTCWLEHHLIILIGRLEKVLYTVGAILIHKPRPMVHSWFVASESHENSSELQTERGSYEFPRLSKPIKNKKTRTKLPAQKKTNPTNKNIFACVVQGSFTFFISQLLSLCCSL